MVLFNLNRGTCGKRVNRKGHSSRKRIDLTKQGAKNTVSTRPRQVILSVGQV